MLRRQTAIDTTAFDFVLLDADNYNGYSWSDGVPETAVTNTPTGVWAFGTPTVRYRATRLYDMDFGSLTLAAVSLGGSLSPTLRLLNPHEVSGSLAFELMTEPGQSYTVEYTDTLPSSNWQTLTTITGDGTIRTVSDPASFPARFYRVRTP